MLVRMPICKTCGEEVDELTTVSAGGKRKRVCEDCAERLEEQDAIAEQSEAVVQQMMGFKGRR
jgi:protein-arginine kinase activator protein McsA